MIVFSRWRIRPGRYCRAGRRAWPPRACLLASPFACPWPGVVGGLHQRGRVRDVICNFNADGFSSLYPKYKGGRPPRFTLAQRREIKKIAKSKPAEHGLPFSTWSLHKLAEFLVAEGVVDDISHEGLRLLLREEGVTFQRLKTWKASADPDYA